MVVAEGFQVPCVTIKGEFVERADSFFFYFFLFGKALQEMMKNTSMLK